MSFQSLLQQAYWRGIPFMVRTQEVEKGRKVAEHEYPYRDGGWMEDIGRKQRVFRFSGHLVGDYAPLLQVALDAALELPGPGLLIHPTLGAMQVALISGSSSVSYDRMRVISVEFVFREQGTSLFPSFVTDTLSKVSSAVSDVLLAAGPYLAIAMTAVGLGASLISAIGAAVVTDAGAQVTSAAADPAAIVAMATALPPPDADTSYGAYAGGSALTLLPQGTTVASLQAQIVDLRTDLAAAVVAAQLAVAGVTALTAATVVSAMAAMLEAARATMNNPADQIRTLATLAQYTPTNESLTGTGAGLRDAFAATFRRCALTSLAAASAVYLPSSYDDAVTVRSTVAAALDVEITAAGDAGDDLSYGALKTLRAAVIADLTARGASLPLVMTVNLQDNLPSLVVAYRIYRDASRSDEVAAECQAVHPAFLPTSLRVLAA